MFTAIVLIALVTALAVLTVIRCRNAVSPNADMLVETHASIDWSGGAACPTDAPCCLLPLPRCSLIHC